MSIWDLILRSAAAEMTKEAVQKIKALKSSEAPVLAPVRKHPALADFQDYDVRLDLNAPIKHRISGAVHDRIVAPRCMHEAPVVLDAGSVTYYIGDKLMMSGGCRIVTNNLAILSNASTYDHPIDVSVVSGRIDTNVLALTGPEAAEGITQHLTEGSDRLPRSRLAVLGLRAYCPERGIAEDTPELTEFQAALFEHAETLVVVAQGEKFVKPAQAPILQSDRFHELLEKRSEEKSLWFVHHEPAEALGPGQMAFYRRNLEDFLSKLPAERVINATEELAAS